MARFSIDKIRELLSASDAAATNSEKGATLESLGKYIFTKVPGIDFYDRNILDGNRGHEIDLAFWNTQNRSDLYFLDPVIIVECKNTSNPVGSNAVGWFVRKLQDRGANFGILLSLNGITGERDGRSNAHSEILSALTRDRIKILVICRNELLNFSETDNLATLLKEKTLQLTLRKAVI